MVGATENMASGSSHRPSTARSFSKVRAQYVPSLAKSAARNQQRVLEPAHLQETGFVVLRAWIIGLTASLDAQGKCGVRRGSVIAMSQRDCS